MSCRYPQKPAFNEAELTDQARDVATICAP
jgi:hypothetical protein